ncbi:MAG: NAD(P)H-binding protein [Polyangiaceae bacterium]|jgi:uncharacterized protein YbjT (DUF2867 family)
MRVILFGATGMVGQAALRECLLDAGVESVLTVGRSATGQKHEKLRELVHPDLTDYSPVSGELAGYDACFFCLGISSAGMSEADYRRVTVDIAAAAGRALVAANPGMTFIFVSGAGTDSTGKSQTMWARVKGEAENAILALPFKGAYAFRPGFIRPMHGIKSRTRSYRVLYAIMWPFVPLAMALFPRQVTTTEKIGRAMLNVARQGAPKRILETPDINAAAGVDARQV